MMYISENNLRDRMAREFEAMVKEEIDKEIELAMLRLKTTLGIKAAAFAVNIASHAEIRTREDRIVVEFIHKDEKPGTHPPENPPRVQQPAFMKSEGKKP